LRFPNLYPPVYLIDAHREMTFEIHPQTWDAGCLKIELRSDGF